jgi:hypothetical protein
VAKCEIVIVFGHSIDGDPWKFSFESSCSAGGVVACWPGQSNSKIKYPIDGLEQHNLTCWWLPIPGAPDTSLNNRYKQEIEEARKDGLERDAREMLGKAILAATNKAKDVCKKECCKSVLIRGFRAELLGAGNKFLPPGFTIAWDCGKVKGLIYGDDGKGPFPWPLW